MSLNQQTLSSALYTKRSSLDLYIQTYRDFPTHRQVNRVPKLLPGSRQFVQGAWQAYLLIETASLYQRPVS